MLNYPDNIAANHRNFGDDGPRCYTCDAPISTSPDGDDGGESREGKGCTASLRDAAAAEAISSLTGIENKLREEAEGCIEDALIALVEVMPGFVLTYQGRRVAP